MTSNIIKNIEQLSDEWWGLREKRLTASHAQAIGTCGKGLNTYVENKMAEYYSTSEREFYTNTDLERGKNLEDEAGVLYSWEYSHSIEKVCFVIHNDYIGCSPDLLVDDIGLGEIKCPKNEVYFKILLHGKVESKYVWQCQMQMFICEREWCDMIFYNPNFEQSLFVERIFPDKKMVEKLLKGFEIGEKLIKDIENKLKGE